MPLTDEQWKAVTTLHRQDFFMLSWPGDLFSLWTELCDALGSRRDDLRIPGLEDTSLIDTSDAHVDDVMMVVELPPGLWAASERFRPGRLHPHAHLAVPRGEDAARITADALLALRAELTGQARAHADHLRQTEGVQITLVHWGKDGADAWVDTHLTRDGAIAAVAGELRRQWEELRTHTRLPSAAPGKDEELVAVYTRACDADSHVRVRVETVRVRDRR